MNSRNEIAGIELKLLVLEDSRQDLELIQENLLDAGFILNLTHVENEADYRASLRDHRFDIILSDFRLPGFDAFEALHISNEICPETPLICISGSIGEEKAIELLKLGAVDYVLKDRPERLPFSVKRALDEAKEKSAYQKAAKSLLESEDRFKQVAEHAQEWIWEVDPDGLYTYSSPVSRLLFGYSPDEIVGKKHFYDFFVPEEKERLMKQILDFFSKREDFNRFINAFVHKDGHVVVISTNASPFYNAQGKFMGYRGADIDITESNRMLEELISAKERAEQSDRLKTAFINNISHEIRTPLNGILGFGRILTEPDLPAEEWTKYYAILENSSNRLINTVSDYMDMAMIVSGTMKISNREFKVQPVFREITDSLCPLFVEKKIGFTVLIPEESVDLTINSDQEFIRKTLNILLNNALKFTKQGSITCGYRITEDFLEFYVQDTGVGIAAEKQEIIFDMFSQEDLSNTRGYEGSGLGLSIARGLVKLLGGTILVISEKGKGSVFTFTVPYGIQPIADIPSIADPKEPTGSSRRLALIAEDDDSNFFYLEIALHKMGYQYVRAVNGVEAVYMCRNIREIDFVLMDIRMPEMDGLEATKLIHEFRPELPIIATTAYAQTGDESRFLEAGCVGYLAKPIKREKLMAVLASI